MKNVKLLSWNIFSSLKIDHDRYDAISAHIHHINPDIVCLQECNHIFTTVFESCNVYKQVASKKSHKDSTITFAKHDLECSSVLNIVNGVVEIKAFGMTIVNCHLPLIKECTTLTTDITKSYIICGDMNTDGSLFPLFSEIDVEKGWKSRTSSVTKKYDRVFTLNLDAVVTAKHTATTYELSDHLPLLITIHPNV
jgi:endonuclease/exonuclease/phosphatase family metal-dependent hydrolase